MNVVRIACESTKKLFLVVTLPDYEGGVEGFALWNGRDWRWLERQKGRTLGVTRYQNQWVTLDCSGKVKRYSDAGVLERKSHVKIKGLNDLCAVNDELYAVGINGAFVRFTEDRWKTIEHSFKAHLFSVCKSRECVLACGMNGLVVNFDGAECRRGELKCEYDLTSISCGTDGHCFAVGGKGETGVLVDVTDSRVVPTPTRQYFIQAVTQAEVYGVDLDGVVWIWDGVETKKHSISNQIVAKYANRTGPLVAFGAEDAIAVKNGDQLEVIQLDLDATFLMDV